MKPNIPRNQFGDAYQFENDVIKRNKVELNVYDIIDYYITQNHSKIDTAQHFNLCMSSLSIIIRHYKIKKPRALSHVHNDKTCLEKYGDKNYNNFDKYKKTCLEKYGVDNIFKDVDRIKQSYLEKYGVDNPNKVKEVRDKIKETNFKLYGVEHYSQTNEFNEKCIKTSLMHYGTEHPMQSNDVKRKFDFYEIAEKAFNTKMKNGTTNTSKPQKYLINELKNIFGKENVLSDYKEMRYPFHCDVYIKSLDMFVELNLYFTHGMNILTKQPSHLFDSSNSADIELLNLWKEKAKKSKFYNNAIHVWTVSDTEKYNTALKNNLNYRCIYTTEELENFIKEMKIKHEN